MNVFDQYRLIGEYIAYRYLRIDPYNEDGMTTTEAAVLTFLLVGLATVVGAILISRAKAQANAIPASVPAPS